MSDRPRFAQQALVEFAAACLSSYDVSADDASVTLVTWPLLLPVTMVVVLFSVIQTFADFLEDRLLLVDLHQLRAVADPLRHRPGGRRARRRPYR
mgnify:CR=1 FL=1